MMLFICALVRIALLLLVWVESAEFCVEQYRTCIDLRVCLVLVCLLGCSYLGVGVLCGCIFVLEFGFGLACFYFFGKSSTEGYHWLD